VKGEVENDRRELEIEATETTYKHFTPHSSLFTLFAVHSFFVDVIPVVGSFCLGAGGRIPDGGRRAFCTNFEVAGTGQRPVLQGSN
jgi:hypothetical protein